MHPVDATVLGDLVARARRSDATALSAPAVGREYDYRRFCTTSWKVGNFLHHLGVRAGVGVAVADEAVPEPLVSLFGAALLGAPVQFLAETPLAADTRAVVVRTGRAFDHELPPGGQRVVYGERPTDPEVAYFERDVWSQNPTEPPDVVRPDAAALRHDDGALTHAEMLDAAGRVVDEWELGPDDAVAVRAPFAHPGTVVAGVVAPLLAGGRIVLPDRATTADCAVATGSAPEARTLPPGAVP